MELIISIITSILTSGVFISGIAWFLKRYFDKKLDYLFQERVRVVETKLKIAEKYEEHIFEILVSALPELQENVYRCRNLIKEIAIKEDQRLLDKATDYWTNLSELLFKYQIYLPEKTFISLHKFKRIIHGTIFLLSANLNDFKKEADDKEHARTKIVQENKSQIERNLLEIDKIYTDISSNIKEVLAKKTNLLK